MPPNVALRGIQGFGCMGGTARPSPPVDGNKRLGWVGLRLFRSDERARCARPSDEAFDFVVSIADGSLREVPEIARRLEAWIVPLS